MESKNEELTVAFETSARTLYVIATRLRVRCGWAANDDSAEEPVPPQASHVEEWIEGLARTNDYIQVVGSRTTKTREVILTLRSFDDWETYASKARTTTRSWYSRLTNMQSTDAEETALTSSAKAALEAFDQRPPTVHVLFLEANWETGSKEHWHLECHIPRQVFSTLAADLVNGACRRLRLAVDLEPCLTDDRYASSTTRSTFGVLRFGRRGSGAVDGWLAGIDWQRHSNSAGPRTSPNAKRLAASRGTDPIDKGDPAEQHWREPLNKLAGTARTGFILILVLLALVVVLR